jgi:peptide/nickel transport system substrate-binding protein
MEPVVINPSNNEDKEEPKNETSTPVSINVTDGNQHDTPVTDNVSPSTEQEPVSEAVPTETSEQSAVPEADHHTEVLPSLAIPAETVGTKKSNKKKLFAGLAAVVVIAAAAFGAFALFNNEDAQKLVADQANQQIDELRIGTTYFPFNKVYPDPGFLVAGSWAVTVQLYEGLVGFEGGDTIVPLLAESWTNPDTKTWVFTLKDNVKFHNGKTLTANDVKVSLDKALADPNTIPLLIDSIDKVTVKDDRRLEITTKEPDAILLNKLLFLYVQGEEKLNGLAVGTGAYRIEDGLDGSTAEKETRLVAFDDYHGGKPAVRKVKMLAYDDDVQMLDAIKQGQIDISDLMLTPATDSEEVSGYIRSQLSDGFIFYLGINTTDKKSPLNKLAVRQALRLSIDPQAFITNTKIPGVPATQISMKLNFGYNPDIPLVKRDVAQAKQLLKDAGYPSGVTLRLSFATSEENLKHFEELKKQAAEAGITLTADVAPDFDTHSTKILDGKTQVYRLGSASAFIDSYDLFAYNFQSTNFNNPELNDLLAKSNTEFNSTERKRLLQQASKLIVDQVAAIPLVESKGTFYAKDTLVYRQELGVALPGDYIRAISVK